MGWEVMGWGYGVGGGLWGTRGDVGGVGYGVRMG